MSNKRNILIVDYQIGNVSSVINAVKKLGHNPILSNSENSFKEASHIILPGVGSFEAGINNIEKLGIKNLILDQVLNEKKPILGICLGMQLFASEGHENQVIKKGLNLIEGKVELLNSKKLGKSYDVYLNKSTPLCNNLYNSVNNITNNDNIKNKTVYLTFDVDGLDSSIMPATGTPEPGGLLWDETLNIIRIAAKNSNIVGADINELSPIKGFNSYNFLAAKLAYKILSYRFLS